MRLPICAILIFDSSRREHVTIWLAGTKPLIISGGGFQSHTGLKVYGTFVQFSHPTAIYIREKLEENFFRCATITLSLAFAK